MKVPNFISFYSVHFDFSSNSSLDQSMKTHESLRQIYTKFGLIESFKTNLVCIRTILMLIRDV